MSNNWFLIILLAISTFLSRIIGVELMAGREMNPTLRLYFSYVPIAVISALIMNQILTTTKGQIVISFPVLIGCITTALTNKITNIFLPSVVIGIAIGLLSRYFLG